MRVTATNVYGECLQKALEDINKYPKRKLMIGPPGRAEDTAHFWTEDDVNIYDRAQHTVPANYAYEGREVDLSSVKEELGKKNWE